MGDDLPGSQDNRGSLIKLASGISQGNSAAGIFVASPTGLKR